MTSEQITLLNAANEFVNRQTRRSHPEGSFDKGGRFYLRSTYDCCSVRRPSRQFPYSQMLHGRSAEHVAHEYGVNASDIRKIARWLVR